MKLFFTLALLIRILTVSNATTRTVTCQNGTDHFLPVTVNAVVGDTILWTWVSGTHIAGPTAASTIPAGAAMFNGTLDATHHSYKYKVTVAGSYTYQCHPASPHGEPGYINVTANATAVQQFDALSNVSVAYPNPFSEKINFETTDANTILLYNMMGEKVRSVTLKSGQTKVQIDASDLNHGIYFYSILKEGIVLETRKIVKE